jgi:hypothetical protein
MFHTFFLPELNVGKLLGKLRILVMLKLAITL